MSLTEETSEQIAERALYGNFTMGLHDYLRFKGLSTEDNLTTLMNVGLLVERAERGDIPAPTHPDDLHA